MYYPRYILPLFEEAMQDTPVLFLNGPRQAGKSTLVQEIYRQHEDAIYVTLDDIEELALAKHDPQAFVHRPCRCLIIDEVQRAPELFLPIKAAVDRDRRPGRFILTGSANILLLPRLADSLAGRIEIFTLLPLSMTEILQRRSHFIAQIFSPDRHEEWIKRASPSFSPSHLTETIVKGGFPEVLQRPSRQRRESWFQSYVTTILQRDVRDLLHIEGITQFPHLLRILATRSGSLLNFGELSRTSSIPATTLRRYFTLLQTLFFVSLVPPWANNRGKRLVKTPKLFFNDTGVLCHLLGCNAEGLRTNPLQWGKVFETFVINEMQKKALWSQEPVSLYHYRTNTGQEVDLLLETPDGRVAAIEIKSAKTISQTDFAQLDRLAAHFGDRWMCGILLYLGEKALHFGKKQFLLPFSTLFS